MYRYDKATGEELDIKPRPRKDELTYRWNWNAPLIISPHSKTRLYSAANKVFRSDDRGNSWKVISEDITSQTDRNTWPVMGQYWSSEAVAKDVSSSLFGTAVSLDESPVKEDLIYVGTDDGVISVSEDAGGNWRQIKTFPGVPEYTYVSDIMASRHDENVVYVAFDNRKRDDFKPYLIKSTDKGKTWENISNNLPENGTVHTLQQDHANQNLLFAGTEFGVYFSLDGGKEWVQMKSGMPTVAIRDMAIQARENDLVLASFGRGFFILDDYTPLRSLAADKTQIEKDAFIFDIPDARMYIQTGGKYGQGEALYHAPNPDFGAVITYFLKEKPQTLQEIRREKEKDLFKEKKPIPQLTREDLRKEEEEVPPYLIFTIRDTEGNIVRKINKNPSEGINRINWDLRYDNPFPVRVKDNKFNPTAEARSGMLALPGKYTVSMDMVVRGEKKELAGPVEFEAVPLNNASLEVQNRKQTLEFQKDLYELARVMRGTQEKAEESLEKINNIRQTLAQSSTASWEMMKKAEEIEKGLRDVIYEFEGPEAKASWEELPPMEMPLNRRLNAIVYGSWSTTYGVTGTMKDNYSILKEEFPPVLNKLKGLLSEIDQLESGMENAKTPWTPGRTPELK